MSVLSSMATAISGLETHGQSLAVISDNIVNANTTGFKASRGEFQTILAQDLNASGSSMQIGRGAMMTGITNLFTQGSVTRTERATDMAIQGNGFFILNGDRLGQTYTRDGAFRFDKQGWLVNTNGYHVQAYQASEEGKITGKLSDIRIPFNTMKAKSTGNVELNVNLDGRAKIMEPMDLTRPEETSQFVTGLQVFDSVGNAHGLNVYFNKTGEGTWEWHGMTDGANIEGGEAGKPSEVVQGQLVFDQEGRLQTSESATVNGNFINGAIPDQQFLFNFGDPIDGGGTGQKGSTQYGSKSSTFRSLQDGFAAGMLADTSIDQDGNVSGVYTNGQNKLMGQIALARFEATERLSKVGENQFRESVDSGQPLIGKANTNGRGVLMTNSLENSNVDLAKEFVEMIKAQRGFQASAKSITTANEMLDEVIQIKRQ
ncbi:MAG: flagellar hook protein FlgE [Deltaproteobacteria bacterium]|nr:flagellar hook protein FlgE [Deltaproteobacteria bacterium]MBI3295195.1 flagellar hook protein FlgE [Deltaproteobacteria bacterium]